jgi:hypothetical protein
MAQSRPLPRDSHTPAQCRTDPLEFSRQLKDNAVQEVIQACADEALARSLPGDESSEGMLMRVPDVVFVDPGTMGWQGTPPFVALGRQNR